MDRGCPEKAGSRQCSRSKGSAKQEWASGLSEDSIGSKISYKDLKGNPYETPLWQIVLHVVNHGTHHRGQVSGFLRALGHTPPPVDLIAYYREISHATHK